MLKPPLPAVLLRQYWRELFAAAITLAAVAVAMAAASSLQDLRDFALPAAFAFGGAAYGVTTGIPFKPRLRGALIVVALAYVADAVLLAREPFIFAIVLELALAVALAVGGVCGMLRALRSRSRQWQWAIGSAGLALVASALLVASLPESAGWLPGPTFGLAMLAHAAALYRLARAGRTLDRRVHGGALGAVAPAVVTPSEIGPNV
jgi:uncharacterized membrane protein HdeD (DUF308 family)